MVMSKPDEVTFDTPEQNASGRMVFVDTTTSGVDEYGFSKSTCLVSVCPASDSNATDPWDMECYDPFTHMHSIVTMQSCVSGYRFFTVTATDPPPDFQPVIANVPGWLVSMSRKAATMYPDGACGDIDTVAT